MSTKNWNVIQDRAADGLSGDGFIHLFCHPEEVLAQRGMTVDQKRELLASWASDLHAVEGAPAMRQLESGAIVRLDDVLAALRALDPAAPPAPRPRPWGGNRRPLRLWGTQKRRRHRSWTDDDDGGDPPPRPAAAMRETLLAA
ncbi:hypothetical protein [Hansschlegelia plantiphila]|uniref:Uncharacterized protein n=1 Tax=Hansschlegelia plantiphila TaxID=374655 RepID=A0A9W6J1W1_9HYPH|nr:hypothetical protein [Hansschlegelia plantiphila]GLK68208.1 hypothetical protein GCM10008179_18460 [Hansschlegelia plantiphila]